MDEQEVSIDPAVEAEAKAQGWSPKEKFRGKPEDWVDAEEFVRRGKQIMPILHHNNKRLVDAIQEKDRKIAGLETEVKQTIKVVQDLKEFQAAEVKRQVEMRVKQLKREMRSAEREGNHELADTLAEEIDELKETIPTAPAPQQAPATPPPPAPTIEPWAQAFYQENKEFLDDPAHAKRFLTECEILNQAEGLTQTALAQKALDNVKSFLGEKKSIPPNKVEGGGRSGNEGNGGARKKGFSDLPGDAKEVCKSQASKFVGEGKAFKTESEWQSHYANVYFGEE